MMMEESLCLDVSDERLWQAFKGGKETAFARIYQRNARALFSYGYRFTTDASLIEDCIHDMFIELWRRRSYLSDISSIRIYLLKALNRKLKRKMIQLRKSAERHNNLKYTLEMPVEFSWINEQTAAENSQKLQQAIAKLTYRQREVLTMHYYEGRNYTEIAKVININYQSVANLMCQTIRKLRKGMQQA